MYKKWLAFIERKDLGFTAIIAIIVSGALGIAVKFLGLLKEAVIANYFGISAEVDFYVLALLITTFLVGPIAGPYGTLLTQKFVELYKQSSANVSQLYCQLITWNSYIFIVLIFCFILLIALYSNLSNLNFGYGEHSLLIFYLLSPIALFSALSVLNSAVLAGQKKFGLLTSIPGLVPFFIIVCVTFNITGDHYQSLILGTVLGYGAECALSFSFNKKLLIFGKNKAFDYTNPVFEKIKHSFFPLFTAKLVMAGCLVIDQFMAGLAGEGSVSIINYSNRIPLGLISILAVVWTVLFPIFSELVSEKSYLKLLKLYIRSVSFCFGFLVLLCLVLMRFSDEIISIIFQRGAFTEEDALFVSSVQSIYFLFIPFFVVCTLSARVANSYQKHRLVLACNVGALSINIVFNLIFIESFGVIGIAYATVISYAIMAIVWLISSIKLISSHCR